MTLTYRLLCYSKCKEHTPKILALKWYRQNMSLEKIYFALWIRKKLGKKEFLKLYIVLLRAELNYTIYASRIKEGLAQHPDSVNWEGIVSWFARKDRQAIMPF